MFVARQLLPSFTAYRGRTGWFSGGGGVGGQVSGGQRQRKWQVIKQLQGLRSGKVRPLPPNTWVYM